MDFLNVTTGILQGIDMWEPKLLKLSNDTISKKRNSQNRTIKQILGHMVDSASNNIHRAVHLQYQKSPLVFPNYATQGNNDRWIAIQNYQDEDWKDLVQLWKYIHFHVVHVINNIDPAKLDNEWISAPGHGNIRLDGMITDFLRHFELHLTEIQELIDQ